MAVARAEAEAGVGGEELVVAALTRDPGGGRERGGGDRVRTPGRWEGGGEGGRRRGEGTDRDVTEGYLHVRQ